MYSNTIHIILLISILFRFETHRLSATRHAEMRRFPTQNCLFAGFSPAVVAEVGRLADHPVAGNDKRNGIFADGTAHRPGGAGRAHLDRHIFIGNNCAEWNFDQRFPDLYLEIGSV